MGLVNKWWLQCSQSRFLLTVFPFLPRIKTSEQVSVYIFISEFSQSVSLNCSSQVSVCTEVVRVTFLESSLRQQVSRETHEILLPLWPLSQDVWCCLTRRILIPHSLDSRRSVFYEVSTDKVALFYHYLRGTGVSFNYIWFPVLEHVERLLLYMFDYMRSQKCARKSPNCMMIYIFFIFLFEIFIICKIQTYKLIPSHHHPPDLYC